jgi:hypothetical protein
MRRSLYSLAGLVAALAVPLAYQASSAAPPKVTGTAKVSRAATARIAVSHATRTVSNGAAANLARTRGQLRNSLRPGTTFYMLQVRNPLWTRSATMTPDLALASMINLRMQGFSAHLHDLGSLGTYVHFGMIQWANRGFTLNRGEADRAAVQFRMLGLQARVVSRRV